MCRQTRSRKYLPTPFKNGFAYYGALRLSPGDRAEGVDGNSDAYNTRIRGKETKVPVACQRRLARARCHVPYLEGVVPGCRHDGLAVGRKNTRRDPITAIF